MFREKLNIANAKKTYILVDSSKFVSRPCEKFPIPIEVFPDSLYAVKEKLLELGCNKLRTTSSKEKRWSSNYWEWEPNYRCKIWKCWWNIWKETKKYSWSYRNRLFIGYNVEIIN